MAAPGQRLPLAVIVSFLTRASPLAAQRKTGAEKLGEAVEGAVTKLEEEVAGEVTRISSQLAAAAVAVEKEKAGEEAPERGAGGGGGVSAGADEARGDGQRTVLGGLGRNSQGGAAAVRGEGKPGGAAVLLGAGGGDVPLVGNEAGQPPSRAQQLVQGGGRSTSGSLT